jgi:hypothetical protein
VFPTLKQQRGHQSTYVGQSIQAAVGEAPPAASAAADRRERAIAVAGASTEESDDEDESAVVSPEVEQTVSDRRRARSPKDSLFLRFRKIQCQASGIIGLRTENGEVLVDAAELQTAVDRELLRAERIAMSDAERVRTIGDPSMPVQVPDDALQFESTYLAFLATQNTDVIPHWRIEIDAHARVDDVVARENKVLRLEVVNVSNRQLDLSGRESPNIEPFLFDVGAAFAVKGAELLPFDLDLAPRGFRYDRILWGRGFNCALERSRESPPLMVTTHTPIYRQGRHSTRAQPEANFAALARDPKSTLEAIRMAMRAYIDVWDAAEARYAGTRPDWNATYQAEFERDRVHFERDIERFSDGLQLILSDPDVHLAFRLTNEAFRKAGENPAAEKRKESWRLFQIVFLVSQIRGMWALAHGESEEVAERELVDIIYFPTGGGKTEAYLAVIVFHCFFDRLRGKSCGTSVWTRFPLRLLTLQQTQRVADVLGMAELVRREQADARLSGSTVGEFAVGYFVGKEGTPNELVDPDRYPWAKEEDRVNWSIANDPKARQAWKRVTRCPSCKTSSVLLDFDAAAVRLMHRCVNPVCHFPQGRIPCYIVDNEVYRYLPAVVVGTIDKLAGVGNQRKLAQVFGQVDGLCVTHGFYKGKCPQKDCTDRNKLRPGVPAGISGPTLFVQDELHLLKEGLGTFDSHYETFVQRLRVEFGQADTLKIIASSATIEAFERQVTHLYGRPAVNARIFPGPGPTLTESFYAQTTAETQRLYVGILPHNKTIFNAILELLEFFHGETQRLANLSADVPSPFSGQYAGDSLAWRKLLDNYVTSVTYFLAGRELNSIRTDIIGDVNPSLAAAGLLPVELHEMTGDTTSDEVTRVLDLLETPSAGAPKPTGILATSMISHGVDVDRLNAMIFYGMPRQTAEYIQASSRVGRSHVGVVFTCLHPVRERDRSHYTYFTKYHEFLGQLIEPVAINRWATFSVERTLPGLFMAVLLQVLANRAGGREIDKYYMLDYVKQRIADGSVRAEDFYGILMDSYLVSGGQGLAVDGFRAEINQRVPQFLDQILSAGPESKFVSEVLIPAPMRSLRDVDESVPIELDSIGSRWASR